MILSLRLSTATGRAVLSRDTPGPARDRTARAEVHGVPHRLEHVGMQLLGHEPDLRAALAVVAQDVVAVHQHGARGRRDDPANDADQRGLAGAVRAKQGEDLALADFQVDLLQRLEAEA